MIKIALIGAGNIGAKHLEAYARMPDVRIEAIVDQNVTAAEQAAAGFEARVYANLDEALKQEAVDVVDICLPTYLHYSFVCEAAQAGKHVICEKPIALSLEQARAMFDVCHKHQVGLYIGQLCRFMKPYRELASIIKQDHLGQVAMVRATRAVPHPKHMGQGWYQETDKSGGLVVDLLIHDLDFITWCFGPADVLSCERIENEQMEGLVALLKPEKGPLIRVEGLWTQSQYDLLHQRLELDGDEGFAFYDSRVTPPFVAKTSQGKYIRHKAEHFTDDPFYEELRHFIAVIKGEEASVVLPGEVMETLRVALEIREKVTEGNRTILTDHEPKR